MTEPVDLGRLPADWLRVKGQMLRLMVRSALLLRSFFLAFFSWSFTPGFFSGITLNKSFHRREREEEVEEEENRMEDGEGEGAVGGEGGWAGVSEEVRERCWRGRRTPLRKSSSAVRRSGGGKEGLRTIQNSNSGEEEGLVELRCLVASTSILFSLSLSLKEGGVGAGEVVLL
ncbi:uncharacterized protein LOC110025171 [Phalaenopsis equestris]|uniref:uncharacterized protein LOC110025171 n=1 Tax=Phalaenopsis equestris TaxID=78828 RepID=UPI0009E263D1|nr:uncharacterized protein LOC110025171 [Phalaenopsis equestris]